MRKQIVILFLVIIVSKAFAENYNVQSAFDYKLNIDSVKTLFILDFSNSMNEHLGSERKVDVMLNTMRAILPKISPQKQVGMRAYGYRMGLTPYDSCKASKLMVPIMKGGSRLIEDRIEKTHARGMTPITFSLKQALNNELANFNGQKHIILLTDGGENCDESPCTFMIKKLREEPNLKIDVIAYNVRNSDDITQLQCVSTVTSGRFYTAETQAELIKSLSETLNIEKEVEGKIIGQ